MGVSVFCSLLRSPLALGPAEIIKPMRGGISNKKRKKVDAITAPVIQAKSRFVVLYIFGLKGNIQVNIASAERTTHGEATPKP